MKKVNQTLFGEKNGNCMAACIASLLDLKIDDVPILADEKRWWNRLSSWLSKKGYSPLEIQWPIGAGPEGQHIFPNRGQVCWAVGNSPRGDFKHAVLVRWVNDNWDLYHDPHPDNAGLDGPIELIGMLVPIWPQIHG